MLCVMVIVIVISQEIICKIMSYVTWIQKGFTVEPREMIRGRISSEMIRIQARKSELQAKSRSYGPKVRVTAGQTPESELNRSEKAPKWGLGASTEKPPLKPSPNFYLCNVFVADGMAAVSRY